MSVQTYINKVSDDILYRLNHLDRFTDHIFVKIDSIPSHSEGGNKFIFYENEVDAHDADAYDICDILHSIRKDHNDYSRITMLLLSCPEHEPTRALRTIVAP